MRWQGWPLREVYGDLAEFALVWEAIDGLGDKAGPVPSWRAISIGLRATATGSTLNFLGGAGINEAKIDSNQPGL